MRSSSCAFFASNSAAVITPRSRRSASCSSCSGTLELAGAGAAGVERRGGRGRRLAPARALPRVRFHLPVELLLHAVGMPHVVERD